MPQNIEGAFKRNEANSLHDLYGHSLAKKGHEIYNFGRPFLGHHNYILSLSDLCLGVEKKIFKEIMHFHNMTYMATP